MDKKIILLISTFLLALPMMIGCSKSSGETKSVEMVDEAGEMERNWQESSLFKSGNYTMIGEEGRLGFIYDDSEVVRFYPDKIQKYMWHFWGAEDELDGGLKVVATHEKDNNPIVLLETDLGGPNNGADRHTPSNLSLPKSGMWKLDAYIEEQLFGTVFVKVHDEN
ncbi:hypothetical protein [Sporosarcina sp. Te-1]|uniref:hypothetical protein n=1 Tax=Sporosarcina sp. Te-1 TaxID=2818390 RepID=UPI001A9EDBAA|nr:hypothetical protein [Sporosarcina sp. Te-1]QTD40383.1 hypothetical protein J3U78_16610 [Sporosarcina sp. Te-1]